MSWHGGCLSDLRRITGDVSARLRSAERRAAERKARERVWAKERRKRKKLGEW